MVARTAVAFGEIQSPNLRRIRKVRCRNLELSRDVEMKLGRLDVFVGANRSGKSSVLGASDCVPVANRRDGDAGAIRRLADHPESAEREGCLRLGESWSSVGEDRSSDSTA
jgi:hypothetical protein